MSKKIIFLSYRRGDSPGYVKTLEEELERHYGKGRVFRDVEDIVGGAKWKQVLENNLRNSSALLLVIGPRWDSLWRERIGDSVNYVEWELNFAQQLGVPVIPVTLDGAMIADDTNLESVAWLRENQFYDISDKQGRWENDFKGLLNILKNIKGLEQPLSSPAGQASPAKGNGHANLLKTGLIGAAIVLAALVVLGALMPESTVVSPVSDPMSAQVDESNNLPEVINTGAEPDAKIASKAKKTPKKYANLDGTWQSSIDGGLYKITHDGTQNFALFASDYGSFVGRFIENQPNKIRITLNAGGSGEFSLSNSFDKLTGWVIYDDGSKDYGSLIKIQ